jgi:A/G-specific adenine glycosylase
MSHLPEIQRALLDWHASNALQAPWRASGDPYECLVAAVMAQQTQMSRVMPSYERFVAAFPTLESLATASAGDVIRVWAGMGYNQRAVRLHRAAREIHASGWPRDAASLARIHGIGPFTAAIIASFAFGETAACVDTNVRRVLGRLAGDEQISATQLQSLADASIAHDAPARWNQAVMDYGARVCGVRPKCDECVVAAWCPSRERYAAPKPRVSDARGAYNAKPRPAKREAPFEGSTRWYRGRIVDALRTLPPGERIPLDDLGARMPANGHTRMARADLDALVRGLERDGLASVTGGGVALPE